MAKRKSSKAAAESPTIDAAPFFKSAMGRVDARAAKKHRYVGPSVFQVIPVPSVAVRYLLQSEGWILSRMSIIAGPEKSYKSTFSIEIGRWHVLSNGYIYYCEAESKPNEELRNSVLWWDTSRIHAMQATSVEEWQDTMTWGVTDLQRQFTNDGGPGPSIPVCMIVDSLTGQGTEMDVAELLKKGHISPGWPRAAKSITGFMRTFPQNLMGWPFSFIGINHLKEMTDDMGRPKHYETGGSGTQYQLSVNIHMRAEGRPHTYVDRTIQNLSMETHLNSCGAAEKRISVPITLWQQPDAEGVYRLFSRFEWYAASTRLLCEGRGMRAADAEIFLPRIKEILGIICRNTSAADMEERRYYSDILGVDKSAALPAHDIGVMLEQRPDLLVQLYPVLGIARRNFFQPGMDFQQQNAKLEQAAQAVVDEVDGAEVERQVLFDAGEDDAS